MKNYLLCLLCLFLFACSEISHDLSDGIFSKDHVVVPTISTEKTYAFAVLGDNRPDSKSLEYFLSMISQLNIDTVFHVGDLVQFSSPLYFISILEAIDSSYPEGNFNAVVGNHDVDGSAGSTRETLDIFKYFFNIDEPFAYRYITENNLHFIILNSYLPDYPNEIDPTQLAWLTDTLDNIAIDEQIFVFLHHPVYPAGHHPPLINRDELHETLNDYPITAVFSGHEHLYYKEVVDGIPYYISGGAGSTLHDDANGLAINHFLAVSVSPNFEIDIVDISGEIVEE